MLFGLLTLSVLVLTVSAQIDREPLPGDPTGPDDLVFVDLDAGRYLTCGVTKANNIRCWGLLATGPVHASGFTDVAVGRGHTCGIKSDGTVQCFGSNNRDQLNVPTNDDDGGTAIQFSSIASQTFTTCGIRSDDDGLVCWGWDAYGQSSGMGSDITYDYSDDAFSQIAVGFFHSCGLLKTEGSVGELRCWGTDPSTIGKTRTPLEHADTVFKAVHVHAHFTCALIGEGDAAGKAVCWGSSTNGVISELPEDARFDQLSAADTHVCGIQTDGTPLC